MSYTQEELKRYAQKSSTNDEQLQFILNEKLIDCFVLKLFLQIESKTGVILILFSELSGNILLMYSIFGNSPTIRRIQPFEKVVNFLQDMLKAHKEGATEFAISERIGRTIYKILTPENILTFISDIENKDFSRIKELIVNGIIQETKLTNVMIELDSEKVNSIQFLKNNPLHGNLSEIKNPFEVLETVYTSQQQTKPTQVLPKTKIEIAIEEITKNYSEVIKCQTVISPVSGIPFDELKVGQKLLFILPFKTPQDRSRARRLGAVNKLGQNQPIVGEFVKLIIGDHEYHIFAKGPGNVLLRAFEEMPVRLAVPKDANPKDLEEKALKTTFLVAGAFVLFILVLLFLYFS